VRSTGQPLFTTVLGVFGIALLVSSAFAADYSVEVGVETEIGKDANSLTCSFDEICRAKIEPLGLTVSIFVYRREPEQASVRLYASDPSCCYFDLAAESKIIDPRNLLSRVSFFKGTRARVGLFILNERAGTLYLRFDYR
jgi:hypothetical protein